MKKEIMNVLYGAIIGIGLAACVMMIGMMIDLDKSTKELIAESEKILAECDILDEYGVEAYETFKSIDLEYEEAGCGGIGEYEFEYWGDTLRINAKSVDGMLRTSQPVGK